MARGGFTVLTSILKSATLCAMAKSKHPEKPACSDDNTERPLIELIGKILTDFTKEIRDELAALKKEVHERNENMATAIEDLQAAINESTVAQTDLTTAVNAAIVRIGTPSANDAAITAAAVAVRANAASDVSLKDSLNTALDTPVVVPTP